MEKIKRFLKNNKNFSHASGCNYDSGSGSAWGTGTGSGYGSGSGFDWGTGAGSGYGYGYGSGWGSGGGRTSDYTYGWGSGAGDGSGNGSGDGYGIKTFNGNAVCVIDGITTIITNTKGNLAKGFLLSGDLTITPCYVIKQHNLFAHGNTLQEAREALQEKIYASMDTQEVIEDFLKTFALNKSYPAREFYIWHNRLTGSCEIGRTHFAKEHNIDLDKDEFTVQEFIKLTQEAYGSDVIKQLAKRIEKR